MADGAHGDTGEYVVLVVETRESKSAHAPVPILLRQMMGRNVPDTANKKRLVTLKYHAQVGHSMATNRHPG